MTENVVTNYHERTADGRWWIVWARYFASANYTRGDRTEVTGESAASLEEAYQLGKKEGENGITR